MYKIVPARLLLGICWETLMHMYIVSILSLCECVHVHYNTYILDICFPFCSLRIQTKISHPPIILIKEFQQYSHTNEKITKSLIFWDVIVLVKIY